MFLGALKWLEWNPDPTSWVQRGHESTRYYSLLVKENYSEIHDPLIMDKFNQLAAQLGFNSESIGKVFAVYNERLFYPFEAYRDTLYGKHRANPDLFKKQDWKFKGDVELRSKFIQVLVEKEKRFLLNANESLPPILPMLQGTSEDAIWQICQQGFSIVGSTDAGFYGQGIYFTSNINYARQYAKKVPNEEQKVIVLCLVTPGNTFPITEQPYLPNGKRNPKGFLGKPCLPGYQSHFTIVKSGNIASAYPVDSLEADPAATATATATADELVIFETAQVVPLFVFYCPA